MRVFGRKEQPRRLVVKQPVYIAATSSLLAMLIVLLEHAGRRSEKFDVCS